MSSLEGDGSTRGLVSLLDDRSPSGSRPRLANARYVWLPEYDDRLRVLWAEPLTTVGAMAAEFGVSEGTVGYHAGVLGLEPRRRGLKSTEPRESSEDSPLPRNEYATRACDELLRLLRLHHGEQT